MASCVRNSLLTHSILIMIKCIHMNIFIRTNEKNSYVLTKHLIHTFIPRCGIHISRKISHEMSHLDIALNNCFVSKCIKNINLHTLHHNMLCLRKKFHMYQQNIWFTHLSRDVACETPFSNTACCDEGYVNWYFWYIYWQKNRSTQYWDALWGGYD